MNKSKEKNKKKNTKQKDLLDLDNEIIIGIKTLPEPEKLKKAKKNNKKANNKAKANKKTQNKIKAKKKPKKTAKQLQAEKKKRRRIFRFVKWTTLIALLIGGSIYFLLSPYFNIKHITASGNEKITSDEIISLSGIKLDENMFKISSKEVEQAVKINAYIDSVNLKRKLPDSIEIQVVERKPAYMLTIGNAYAYINSQGYILEISKESLKLQIITGIATPEEDIEAGNRLCTEDLEKLNSVIQIMDSANSNELGDLITKINIENKQDYVLELKSEKKNVHLGDTSDIGTKMLYIKTVLENEKGKEGDIFVNTDLNNNGAIFREKV